MMTKDINLIQPIKPEIISIVNGELIKPGFWELYFEIFLLKITWILHKYNESNLKNSKMSQLFA